MCFDSPDPAEVIEFIGLPEYPAAPAPRDLGQEYEDILNVSLEYAPRVFAAEAITQPAYARLQRDTQQDLMTGPDGSLAFEENVVQPASSRMSARSATAQRTADIADVENLAPRAAEAFAAANPQLQALLDSSATQALGAVGGSAISAELEAQSLEQLQSAGYLTEAEQRQATQSARAAYSDRGLVQGPEAMASEVLMADTLVRQRQAEAQQFGMSVEGQRIAREQAERGAVTQAAQLQAGSTVDPFAAILGRAVTSPQQAAQSQALSGSFMGTQPQFFDPQNNAYASELYSGNQDAAMAAYQTQYQGAMDVWGTQAQAGINAMYAPMNMQSAMMGGAMNTLGSLGQAYTMCWVAREVYGRSNPRWLMFRHWLLTEAPAWFRRLYRKNGESFAKWVHNKPRLKSLIRAWMDTKVRRVQWAAI